MRTHTQFDPSTRFDELMIEMESSIYETLANFERLTFLRKKIAEEMTAAQAAADRLELLTEAEAGQLFKLNDDPQKAERAMRDLRRKFQFPFCRVGREVRYTREQLREITALLEINGKQRKPIHSSPLRRAA